MKKRLISVLIILGVLVIIMGVLLLTQNQNANPTASNNNLQVSVGTTHSIAITNYMFTLSQLIIKVGDTVVWINNDTTGHTVTSDSGSELNSSTIAPGNSYSHTFNTSGTFDYHCSINPSMIGEIIVQ